MFADFAFISLNNLKVPPYKSSNAITWSPGLRVSKIAD